VTGLTDKELRQSILRWVEVTQQLDEVGRQLGRIKAQYAQLQYPGEIETLTELEPINRRRRELTAQERDLRSQSCRLGNEQANLDEQIRATLPINVWYRVNGHRMRWISEPHSSPRLVCEAVRERELAA
jgi:chromosome segregation ATPase